MKILVGHLVVSMPREVTEYYECAAWHKTIVVCPGTYPVYAFPSYLDGELGHSLSAPVTGWIKSACFVSRLGSHYGKDDGPSKVGHLDEGHIRMATFDIDRYLLEGLSLDALLVLSEPIGGTQRRIYRLDKAETMRRFNRANAAAWRACADGGSRLDGKELSCVVYDTRYAVLRGEAEVYSFHLNNTARESMRFMVYETARGIALTTV